MINLAALATNFRPQNNSISCFYGLIKEPNTTYKASKHKLSN